MKSKQGEHDHVYGLVSKRRTDLSYRILELEGALKKAPLNELSRWSRDRIRIQVFWDPLQYSFYHITLSFNKATWASSLLTMLSITMKVHTHVINPPCFVGLFSCMSESSRLCCVQKTSANDSVLSFLIHPDICLTFTTHL